MNEVLPNRNVSGDFALAPDNRRLAFFGCEAGPDTCGVFLLDLETGIYKKLVSAASADYFLWKPDGEYLAAVVSLVKSAEWQYVILRTTDGKIIYTGKFDWNRLEPDLEAPTASWGVRHQIKIGGLGGCAYPTGLSNFNR